jgi:hypothetical protein
MVSMSHVKQVFGYTPDETAFARVWLERETVANALTMVQPALLSYGLGGPPQPALLDVASIQVCRVRLSVVTRAATQGTLPAPGRSWQLLPSSTATLHPHCCA